TTKTQSKTKQISNSPDQKTDLKTSETNDDVSISNNVKSFSFNDLKEATRNFRQENLIGEGGFGFVFKGWIDENTGAPTKPGNGIVVAIKRLKPESFQEGVQPISWMTRINIAIGVARGLAFLHSLDANVIYRDLKASNILLDSDFNANLSDFGLARDGPTGDNTHVSTRVIGTHGYAAPEYVATVIERHHYAYVATLLAVLDSYG
ncbi:hypothetical protein TSUD_251290, partial [Trifolium subterraneum]